MRLLIIDHIIQNIKYQYRYHVQVLPIFLMGVLFITLIKNQPRLRDKSRDLQIIAVSFILRFNLFFEVQHSKSNSNTTQTFPSNKLTLSYLSLHPKSQLLLPSLQNSIFIFYLAYARPKEILSVLLLKTIDRSIHFG